MFYDWPVSAEAIMQEISDRIGAPLDPRTAIPPNNVDDNALSMTMRQVAGYIAAMMGGVWTITDEGYLYLVPIGMAAQVLADENGVPLLFGEELLSV